MLGAVKIIQPALAEGPVIQHLASVEQLGHSQLRVVNVLVPAEVLQKTSMKKSIGVCGCAGVWVRE